jgi:hypothetical protein
MYIHMCIIIDIKIHKEVTKNETQSIFIIYLCLVALLYLKNIIVSHKQKTFGKVENLLLLPNCASAMQP